MTPCTRACAHTHTRTPPTLRHSPVGIQSSRISNTLEQLAACSPPESCSGSRADWQRVLPLNPEGWRRGFGSCVSAILLWSQNESYLSLDVVNHRETEVVEGTPQKKVGVSVLLNYRSGMKVGFCECPPLRGTLSLSRPRAGRSCTRTGRKEPTLILALLTVAGTGIRDDFPARIGNQISLCVFTLSFYTV